MQRRLVERAMEGDQEAFADLAVQHIDRCYALAYRILRDQSMAQDASQQALLKAWQDLPTLREPDRFDAWLYRVVVHACYLQSRSHRRWTAKVRTLPIADVTPDPATSIADRDALERAFRRLTPEQRAIVVMHHHLGHPLTEIAATLGIPEGTARSRLHYAVRLLRTALDTDGASVTTSQERSA